MGAGQKGRAFTFFMPGEFGADELAELLRGAKQEIPLALEQLADECRDRREWRDWRRNRSSNKGGGKGRNFGRYGRSFSGCTGKEGAKGRSKGRGRGWC